MIDTHCHLDYLDDPASARGELGLTAMVCIGASPEHARNAVALAEQFPDVYATVGLHPTDTAEDSAQARQELEALAAHPRVVGIGESGLDDYWDATAAGRPAQRLRVAAGAGAAPGQTAGDPHPRQAGARTAPTAA